MIAFSILSIFLPLIQAYIPAISVNDTSGLVASADIIHIAWLPNGVYSTGLSRQLVASSFDDAGNYTTESPLISWSKFSKGVLVHYSENFTAQPTSEVPWIALINCDTNGTVGTFSDTADIFTLARDHGAQAAVLYSLVGQGCLINQDYLQNFEKVLDVYATNSQQGARLIESQFINVGGSAYNFDSQMMNNSASVIQSLLNVSSLTVFGGDIVNPNYNSTPTAIIESSTSTGTSSTDSLDSSTSTSSITPSIMFSTGILSSTSLRLQTTRAARRNLLPRATTTPTSTVTTSAPPAGMTIGANYLAAVLAASNITVGGTPVATPTPSAIANSGGPNTGLAMIILYAITGVVTFMFLVVILAGAIRAIRHPERYGPRAGNYDNGQGGHQQSRASGLTRAILDTFPVVKFGRSAEEPTLEEGTGQRRRNGGELTKGMEMSGLGINGVEHREGEDLLPRIQGDDSIYSPRHRHSDNTLDISSPSSSSTAAATPSPILSTSLDDSTPLPLPLTINPIDVDDGTCPICVCEFESGEDIRILPCDGRHRFHRDCIDPWLLKVSALCPLCRLDLSRPGFKSEEVEEAEAEQVVISNLRAMLHGGRGGSSNSQQTSGGASGSGSGSGSGLSNNRFFRYVASKRQSGRSFGPDVPIDEE